MSCGAKFVDVCFNGKSKVCPRSFDGLSTSSHAFPADFISSSAHHWRSCDWFTQLVGKCAQHQGMSTDVARGESKNVKLQRKIASVVSGQVPATFDGSGDALLHSVTLV